MDEPDGLFWTGHDAIRSVLKQSFKDSKTKISTDGLRALCHYMELFVQEGVLRAEETARQDQSTTVEFDHLEQVFVQLLLDF